MDYRDEQKLVCKNCKTSFQNHYWIDPRSQVSGTRYRNLYSASSFGMTNYTMATTSDGGGQYPIPLRDFRYDHRISDMQREKDILRSRIDRLEREKQKPTKPIAYGQGMVRPNGWNPVLKRSTGGV